MKEQIEIYKIILKGKDDDNFGRFIDEKYGPVKSKSSKDIFQKLFKSLIIGIDKKVWQSPSNQMGLTVLSSKKDIFEIFTPHSGSFIIDGYIDGGHYDMLRKLTKLSDTSNITNIDRDNMVTDRFYVYLYINPLENIGILMVEKKGQLSISSAFSKYIEKFFKINNYRMCKVMRYYPTYLIEEFKKGAIIDSVTCSDKFVKQVYGSNNEVIRNAHYNVSIRITPIDEEDKQGDKNHIIEQLKSMFFSLTGSVNNCSISNFSKKQGRMKQDNGKICPFVLDNEDTIKPIVLIDDNFYDPIKGILKRNMIKSFCDEILKKIRSDIYVYE